MYFTKSHSNYPGEIRTLIIVTNNTDETLDDVSPMAGVLEIKWDKPTEDVGQFGVTKTFKLTANNIFHAKYNKFTKRLTIDPGDSVVLSVDWNLVTDDGTDLYKHFSWKYDTKCKVLIGDFGEGYRQVSDPQNFLVKANIKLFDQLAVLYINNIKVSQCFMYGHAGEGDLNRKYGLPPCTDFTQFDPCSVIK